MIPDIEQKISHLLQENSLIPDISVEDFFAVPRNRQKKFYITPCLKDGKKIFLKVLIKSDPECHLGIWNEIKFYLQFGNIDYTNFQVPSLIAYGNTGFYWYLRDYIIGDIIGDVHYILPDYKEDIHQYAEKVVQGLIEIAKINVKNYPAKDQLSGSNLDYYLSRIQKYNTYIKDHLPNFQENMVEILEGIKDQFDQNPVLVHGDFHFGNFFFEGEDKLTIGDWEYAHIGGLAEDFAQLWTDLWQFPDEQKHIYRSFLAADIDTQAFQKLLPAMIKCNAARELQHWIYYRDFSANPEKPSLEFCNEGIKYFMPLLEGNISFE